MSTADITLTNNYWGMLRNLNDDVKLRLASLLTASVVEHRTKTVSEKEDGMEKYADVYYVFAIPLVLILILELYIFSRRGRL